MKQINYLEIQELLISSLIVYPEQLLPVMEVIGHKRVFQKDYQEIYDAITSIFESGKAVDQAVVCATVPEHTDRVLALVSRASPTGATTYAYLLVEHFIKKSLEVYGLELAQKARKEVDAFDLLELAEGRLFKLGTSINKRQAVASADVMRHTMLTVHRTIETGFIGIRTGYRELDDILGGLRPGELTILAGRPSCGKTALGLNIARKVAGDGNGVVFFSCEMSTTFLALRLLASEAKVDSHKLQLGLVNDEELRRVEKAHDYLATLPIFYEDSAGISIGELRAKSRRLKRERNIQLVVVDYLQLVSGGKRDTREQEVSSISRTLKAIAKELDIPVLCLSQLNRALEARKDKKPVLADLRESGAIEQDADVVIFIHKPEHTPLMRDVIVEKQRNGPVGQVSMYFNAPFVQFEEFE